MLLNGTLCIALHIAVCLLFYLYLLYKFPPEEHYGCHTKDPEQDWSLTQYYFSCFSQSKINVICDQLPSWYGPVSF